MEAFAVALFKSGCSSSIFDLKRLSGTDGFFPNPAISSAKSAMAAFRKGLRIEVGVSACVA
jgi:hypothetical protein